MKVLILKAAEQSVSSLIFRTDSTRIADEADASEENISLLFTEKVHCGGADEAGGRKENTGCT